ncbi:hypothetical protein [Paenibacillus ehimensis]|uniref:Uncharacterized protein n=1 Tax=Paenibacillus ehimensis TaxID=79264 RepID=A0ABT8VCN8_9BACL|nr:hypothetical protein [Paenibacillus ehimensis]MDO3678722.1 hypothetical protein [Paenibacillus ehimensis]MEC0211749.1 hypothetical protein [Paenibacillus ehimensis]
MNPQIEGLKRACFTAWNKPSCGSRPFLKLTIKMLLPAHGRSVAASSEGGGQIDGQLFIPRTQRGFSIDLGSLTTPHG